MVKWSIVALPLVVACATKEPSDQSTAKNAALPGAPAVTRGEREAVVEPPPAIAPDQELRWSLHKVASVTGGADGDGWAFDFDPHQFPARGLDPVLVIGNRKVTNYTYSSRTVLRFHVPAGVPVHDGDVVAVQWGNDERTRRVVTESLQLSAAVP